MEPAAGHKVQVQPDCASYTHHYWLLNENDDARLDLICVN